MGLLLLFGGGGSPPDYIYPVGIRKPVADAYYDVTGHTTSGTNFDSYFKATMPAPSGATTWIAIVHAEIDDWTPANNRALYGWQSNQQNLEVISDGKLRFRLTGVTDGVSGAGLTTSTVAVPGLVANTGYYFKVDYSNTTDLVKFYYSTDDPSEVDPLDVTWTQVGSDVAVTGSPSSAATEARLGDSGSGYFDGKIRRFWLEIDGTVEADVDFKYFENGDTSFTDLVGNSWTGNTSPFITPAVAVLEAVGEPSVELEIAPSGIASAEAFGSHQINLTVSGGGVGEGEVVPEGEIILIINPTGIASEEAFGDHTVIGGTTDQTISPTGIASAEAFGTAKIILHIEPSGIGSSEAFGDHAVVAEGLVLPSGIGTGEAFGTAKIILHVDPSGVTSVEAFGTPLIVHVISPTGIASAEAFGTAEIDHNVDFVGIPTQEAFGTPTIVLVVEPSGIGSGEEFGTPTISATFYPEGIESGEEFGTALITLHVVPVGIASAEAFGTAEILLTIYIEVDQSVDVIEPAQIVAASTPVQTITVQTIPVEIVVADETIMIGAD